MNYIVLDFETYDPWIEQGRGSGWPEKQAKFLCACTKNILEGLMDSCYITSKQAFSNKTYYKINEFIDSLQYFVNDCNEPISIISHNALYEAGILHSYGFNIESVTWIDTAILAKLFYNNLYNFSLNGLSKKYLGKQKDDFELGEIAKKLGLVKTIVQDPIKIAKKHMDLMYQDSPSIVEKYCKMDVELCYELFIYFMYDEKGIQRFSQEVIDFHSDLIKALTLSRAKGVRCHVPTAKKLKKEFEEKSKKIQNEIKVLAPKININSSKQLAQYFQNQGIEILINKPTKKMLEKDPHSEGNPSLTKEWFNEVDHPLGKLIIDCKKYEKFVRDFINPILELSKDNEDYLRVYPEIKIYGAAATGRASCNSPNLQQIPKRDKDGQLVRSIYRPEDNEKWYSLDFSSQESRLQVHYGYKVKAKGANELIKEYNDNPLLDLHQKVAELAGIDRKEAKTINLGLSYGMGLPKLSKSLKVSLTRAKFLKQQYDKMAPFLSQLNQICKKIIKERGYLKSLLGRKIYNEERFERKALNKLIQGGAADQTWKSIVDCYRAGFIVSIPVHDELNFSLNSLDQAKQIKYIMEHAIELVVPSHTDIMVGSSWGDLKNDK